ncbi:MAG TPA: Uma2 family endonuclease [Polyangiaceae bacterium]|jgi:Uma2 family endonuclease
MTVHAAHRKYSISEYVQLEDYSNVRHEYFDGQIYAMAGGTPEHGTYAANVIGLLTAQLRGRPCRVQTSDVRIRVQSTGLDTYPDVSVVCGRAETDAEDRNAIINPTVVVEILSTGTEAYDRGEKLEHYQKIASLHEVVLVAHDERRVEVVRRLQSGEWNVARAVAGEVARLESLSCELPVDDVYRDPLAG